MLNKRNYGIDLLRIMAMFFIVFIHVLGKSGISFYYPNNSIEYNIINFVVAVLICCVNLFGLISGYVLVKHKFKVNKIFMMYLQVVVFCILNFVLFLIFDKNFKVDKYIIIRIFTPMTHQTYWYYSCYFMLFLLFPYFNIFIESINKKVHMFLIVIMFITNSIISWKFQNIWFMYRGFSFIWLSNLYFIGAYIKKYDFKIKKVYCKLIFVISLIMVYLTYTQIVHIHYVREILPQYIFVSYNGPFVLFEAISLMLIFKDFNIKNKYFTKIITFVSPLTFGVYLLHEMVFSREYIMRKIGFLTKYNVFLIVLFTFLFAVAIFSVCIIIEYIRVKVFKLCRINKLVNKITKGLQNKVDDILKNEKEINNQQTIPNEVNSN